MKPTRSYEVYIDGASLGNPGPAGVGVVFQDGGPAPVRELSRPVGQTTNNVAEYLALLYALHEAVRAGWSRLAVKTDSELLARQINGQYRVRDPFLRCLHDLALDLVAGFDEFTIQHVPREQNAAADRLAGQAAKRQR